MIEGKTTKELCEIFNIDPDISEEEQEEECIKKEVKKSEKRKKKVKSSCRTLLHD